MTKKARFISAVTVVEFLLIFYRNFIGVRSCDVRDQARVLICCQ